MPTQYFISPMTTVLTPRGVTAAIPLALRYCFGTGIRANSIGINAAAKSRTLCAVIDVTPEVGAQLAADSNLIELPFGDGELNNAVSSLDGGKQTAIVGGLAQVRIPTAWIQPSHQLRAVLRFFARVLVATTRFGADYPEVDLALQFGSLSSARRNAIRNVLQAAGLNAADLTNSSTIENVVNRIGQMPFTIQLGDEVL